MNIDGTEVVRCTPAMSVSSVASESYRPNDLSRRPRNFRGNLETTDQMIYVSSVAIGPGHGAPAAFTYGSTGLLKDSIPNIQDRQLGYII